MLFRTTNSKQAQTARVGSSSPSLLGVYEAWLTNCRIYRGNRRDRPRCLARGEAISYIVPNPAIGISLTNQAHPLFHAPTSFQRNQLTYPTPTLGKKRYAFPSSPPFPFFTLVVKRASCYVRRWRQKEAVIIKMKVKMKMKIQRLSFNSSHSATPPRGYITPSAPQRSSDPTFRSAKRILRQHAPAGTPIYALCCTFFVFFSSSSEDQIKRTRRAWASRLPPWRTGPGSQTAASAGPCAGSPSRRASPTPPCRGGSCSRPPSSPQPPPPAPAG